MGGRKVEPIHPGEVLLHDFLEPLGLSQYRLAHDISVPPRRINEACEYPRDPAKAGHCGLVRLRPARRRYLSAVAVEIATPVRRRNAATTSSSEIRGLSRTSRLNTFLAIS